MKKFYMFNKKISLLFSCFILLMTAMNAQPITTTFANNNGNALVTFNFQNTNAYDVQITDISSITGISGANTGSLWYKTSAIAGAPGAISTANGWTNAASQAFTGVANTTTTTPQLMMTGLTLIIPAGMTYGLAYTCSSLRYSTLTAGVYTIPGGGCNLITGTNMGYGGAVPPAAPINTPRGFIGSINFVAAVPCAGTPTPGNTVSSVNPVCSGVNFSLSLQNLTSGSGVVYQWQSSPDGVTYTNIPAATNSILTTTQTAATYYQCIVTCTNSLSSATSTAVFETMNSLINCYCTSSATSTADEEILNVSLGTLNNTSTCATTGGAGSVLNEYSDYTGTVAAPVISQATSYPFSVNVGTCGGSFGNGIKIYIDYNQNGLFTDAGENVYTSAAATTGPHTESGTITVPVGATIGNTRMRVVCVETGTPSATINPCGTYTWGETEDYLVNIVAATACTGTPNGGNTTSTAPSVCSTTSFTLGMSTPPTGLTGITYQWQSSPDGITYTNIGGATNATYTTTQSAATYYWCVVTCTLSAMIDTTTTLQVMMNPPTACYCTPTYGTGTGAGDYISLVQIPTTTLNNASAGAASPYYTLYPASGSTTATLATATPYTLNVAGGTYGTCYISVWGDWNQNGIFEASEFMGVSPNAGGTTTVTFAGGLTVPASALAGTTRLRFRSSDTSPGPISSESCAATNSPYGEAEDYVVTIVASSACTGTPNGGNTTSSAASVCSGVSFTLGMTTPPAGATGITYQWQSSPDGIAYADISGATLPTYTTSQTAATYYWCIITCTNSGMIDTTTTLQVTMNPFMSCYCSSGASFSSDEEIFSVTVNGALNAYSCTTVAPGPGSVLNQYSNFTTLPALTSVSLGQNVAFTVGEDECDGATYYAFGTAIWIDYNHNGSFSDAGEEVFVEAATATGPRNVVGTFLVPAGALLGNTQMRITCAEGYSGAALDPCLSYGYGETEDYLINIVAPTPCSGTPAPGTTMSTTTSTCSGTSFTLSMSTPPTTSTGITYQWQSSPDNITYSNIAGATSFTYLATATTTLYYQCVVTCSAGPSSATTTPILVTATACTDVLMTNGSSTTCGAHFYDSGGASANYLDNENYVYTFNPNPGNVIHISWNSFDSESGFDFVTIYDGPTTASPILYGPSSGVLSIPAFTSSDPTGAITIEFTSDGSVNHVGWDAIVTCISLSPSVTSYTPTAACQASGDSVVITGTNFNGSTAVTFNGAAAGFVVNSATQITAALPAAATSGVIAVTSPGGTGSSSTNFTVNPLPVGNLSDVSQCAGTVPLDAGNAGSTYMWNDASTAQTLTASVSGTYYVTVTSPAGCISSDTSHVAINPYPVVNLGNDSIQCGGSILLDAGNAGSTYAWNDASTAQTLSVVANGTYSVTVTTPAGCSASDAVNISIDPLPVVNLGADTAQCTGTVMLDAGNPGETFLWNDASTAQTLTAASTGTYYVSVTNTSGCTATDTINVAINPLPVVNLGADTVQCAGTIMLDAGNAGSNFTWNDASTAQTLTAAATGTYSVTVTNPATGCSASDAVNVTINALPVVNIGPDSVRCGGSVMMNAGNPGSTYLWSETSTTQTLTVSASGLYYVTVTNTFGCSASDSANITINMIPVVNLGADTSQCGGSVTVDAGNPGLNYAWSNLATTQTITLFTTDTVDVTVTNPATGCYSSDTIAVHIGQFPVVDLGADTTQCAGTVTLNAANPTSSVLWSTGASTHTISTNTSGTFWVNVTTGFGCSTADTIVVTINSLPAVGFTPFTTPVCLQAAPFTLTGGAPSGGVYTGTAVTGTTYTPMTAGVGVHSIMYTVTNASTGCSNSTSQNITIQDCTGITENTTSQEVNVYPNPTEGIFNISITNATFNELIITIVDIQGKQVYGYDDKNISPDYNKQIDLEGLAKGIYYIKLNTGTDVKIQKLIIN